MKTPITRMITLATVLTLGAQPALRAQTTASETTPPKTEKDDVYQLTPFVVNTDKDTGYVAVDSLAGGRTNTPIKFTPASMSAVTRTAIDDIGIQNVREALKWTPNVVPEDINAGKGFGGSAFHDWAFNYRGAGAGEQGGPGPTRNYFSFYQNQDTYNVERIEFLRGPNSIIFGLGTVGGQLSTYTKIPRTDRNHAKATLTVDNNKSNRLELDVNRRLSDTVAVRVNAVNDNNNGWRENDVNKTRAVDVAALWKISDSAQVRIEGEYAKIDRTLISSSIGDKVSGWDGVTASNTWGAAPTGGTSRTIPIQNAGAWGDWLNPFWVYVPSLPSGKQLMGWAGGYATTGSMVDAGQALNFVPYKGWLPTQIKLPWETSYSDTSKIPVRPSYDWTYGNGQSDIDYRNVTITYDQKLTENLDFTAAFYRYYDSQVAKDYEGTGGASIDINKQLPDGTANPNFGKAFADFFLSKQVQTRSVVEGRTQLNYHFDSQLFGSAWKQLFSVSASKKQLKQSARQYLGQVGNGTTISNPADWVQNMVWGRIYLDNPNQIMAIPEVVNGRAVSYMPKADGYWFDFDDTFKLTDVAVMSQSSLFNDALTITVGARREDYDENLRELRRGANLTDNIVNESQSGNTYSAGAVYYLKGGLGVVANWSKNIQPPHAGSQPLLSGARPNPEEGKGLEYGLRYSTSDNKYYATLVRYDTKSRGHLVENPIGFRGIWQKYNEAQNLATNSGNGNMAFSDTTSLNVQGYEFEITANPTKNLRLIASYGTQDTSKVDYYPDSRGYFAANLATWNAVVNNSALDSTKRNTLRSEIASVENALAQATPGTKQDGQLKYTVAFFANYTFSGQMLKGFEVGGGATYAAKPYAGILDNEVYYGDSRLTTNLSLQYHTKIMSVPTHFALYVDNVFDDQDPWVTSYHWGYTDSSGRHIKDGYILQAPRTFRLAARLEF